MCVRDEMLNELHSKIPDEVHNEALDLLNRKDMLGLILDDIEIMGVCGERMLTATIYLIGTSRLLKRPLAGIVQGKSSSGKSYIIDRIAELFPPFAMIGATQMTPQALFHMPPGSLVHRFIVAGERSRLQNDERAEATRALREMLSSGKLTKLITAKIDGKFVTDCIDQQGPIAFIESTTKNHIFNEDANRCLMLHTDDGNEQTRRVNQYMAKRHRYGVIEHQIDSIVERHHALQLHLESMNVKIPFAERLADLFPSERVELRRAFPHLLSMIEAVTLLHQYQRDRDAEGCLFATPDDYHLARCLLIQPMAKVYGAGVSDHARSFHEQLRSVFVGQFNSNEAQKLSIFAKSTVHIKLNELHEAGLLRIVKPGKGTQPTIWCVSEKTIEDIEQS